MVEIKVTVDRKLGAFVIWLAAFGAGERAAQLPGAIVSLRATLQVHFDVPEQAEFDRTIATLRAKQEEAAFNAAWAHGQTLSIEDDAFAVFMAAPARP